MKDRFDEMEDFLKQLALDIKDTDDEDGITQKEVYSKLCEYDLDNNEIKNQLTQAIMNLRDKYSSSPDCICKSKFEFFYIIEKSIIENSEKTNKKDCYLLTDPIKLYIPVNADNATEINENLFSFLQSEHIPPCFKIV